MEFVAEMQNQSCVCVLKQTVMSVVMSVSCRNISVRKVQETSNKLSGDLVFQYIV